MNNNTWDKGRGGGICHKQVRYQHLHIPGDALLEMQWRQHTPNTQLFKWKFAHFCRCCTFHAGIRGEKTKMYWDLQVLHDGFCCVVVCRQDPWPWHEAPSATPMARSTTANGKKARPTCNTHLSIHSATIACMIFNAINTRMHVSHSHVNVTLALDSCNEALAWSED